MLDTLRRMFRDVRPFDILMFVIEVLVLLLIAYEVGSGIWYRIRRNRRSRHVREYLSAGQAPHREAPTDTPTANAPTAEIEEWIERVHKWTDSTNKLLKRYSLEASVSFLHPAGDNFAFDFKWDRVPRVAKGTYAELQQHINNLRGILERPDVYL